MDVSWTDRSERVSVLPLRDFWVNIAELFAKTPLHTGESFAAI